MICDLCGATPEYKSSPGLTRHCKECWWAIKRLVAHYRATGKGIGLREQYQMALERLREEWYS